MCTVFLQIVFASDQDLQKLRRHSDLMRASLREGATSLTPISMSLRKSCKRAGQHLRRVLSTLAASTRYVAAAVYRLLQ